MENKIKMREINPCNNCKNGPKPGMLCTGCRNFAYACKLHNVDPTAFGPVKIDITGITPTGIMESKTSRYSEAQKKAVKMYLDFLCKIINYTLHNDIPLEKSKVAFLESIFDNIIRCAESQNCAETALSYSEQD